MQNATKIKLTKDERKSLESIIRKSKSAQRDVLRAKIILKASDGDGNKTIAEKLEISRNTVIVWRERFSHQRLDGLKDKERSGRPTDFSPRRTA